MEVIFLSELGSPLRREYQIWREERKKLPEQQKEPSITVCSLTVVRSSTVAHVGLLAYIDRLTSFSVLIVLLAVGRHKVIIKILLFTRATILLDLSGLPAKKKRKKEKERERDWHTGCIVQVQEGILKDTCHGTSLR